MCYLRRWSRFFTRLNERFSRATLILPFGLAPVGLILSAFQTATELGQNKENISLLWENQYWSTPENQIKKKKNEIKKIGFMLANVSLSRKIAAKRNKSQPIIFPLQLFNSTLFSCFQLLVPFSPPRKHPLDESPMRTRLDHGPILAWNARNSTRNDRNLLGYNKTT